MEEERWQGDRCNFLANNCQHLACELASQLHVSPLPPEIHRVTRAAQAVACNDGWSPTTRGTTAYATPSPRSQFSELTFLQSLPIHQLIRLLFLLVLMAVLLAFGGWWQLLMCQMCLQRLQRCAFKSTSARPAARMDRCRRSPVNAQSRMRMRARRADLTSG